MTGNELTRVYRQLPSQFSSYPDETRHWGWTETRQWERKMDGWMGREEKENKMHGWTMSENEDEEEEKVWWWITEIHYTRHTQDQDHRDIRAALSGLYRLTYTSLSFVMAENNVQVQ